MLPVSGGQHPATVKMLTSYKGCSNRAHKPIKFFLFLIEKATCFLSALLFDKLEYVVI